MHARFLTALLFTSLSFYSLVALGSQQANKKQNPIIIGLDADMSGSAKQGGIAISRGAQLAIDEINNNGGVLGRQLELLVKDHRGNPARGIKNIETFAKTPHLAAVIGGVHTPVALEQLDSIHKNNLIYLGAWAAGTGIVDNNRSPNNVFRVSIRDEQAGEALVLHAKSKGAKRLALVLERTGWGRSNLRSIRAAAKKHDLSIVHEAWINWRQQSFTEDTNNIEQANPDAILLVSNAPEGAVLVKHMMDKKLYIPIVSHWGIAGGTFSEAIGKDAITKLDISVLQTFHFAHPNIGSKGNELFTRYSQKYDPDASKSSIPAVVGIAQAYDLVHMLALALIQAGEVSASTTRTHLLNLSGLEGAIKSYQQPFSKGLQDALLRDDYFMTQLNSDGQLVPIL